MNNTKDAMYCRLCAELKKHNTLINLQTDEETCQKVVNRLSRFNIIMDFQENILPKTVCLICVKSLERAFVFVTAVEQAQAFLCDFILVKINTSASDSCDENMLYETPDNKNGIVNVKEENSQNSMELNDDSTNLSEKCDDEVMTKVYNDSSVFNVKSEEHIFENKHDIHSINNTSNEIIEENTVLKDEYVELLDIYRVEDNKKDILEKELKSEAILLDYTVSSAENINKQNYSYEGTKNMDKSVQQVQPQECSSEQIALLSTTVDLKTEKKDTKQKTKKTKQKTSNMTTKHTDTDVKDIKMSWKDYEWKCCYCEALFLSIEELQKHSMQRHNSCNPYQCADCVTRCSNLNRFLKHVRSHKFYLNYSCYKCLKEFPKLYSAGHHKTKVHEDSDYICAGCNTSFHSNKELKEHVNKFYKLLIRKTPFGLKCSICNKNTASANDLKKHLLTHEKKDYVCETCGKCYFTKKQLKAHLQLHSAVKILHPCDICNVSFVCPSKLRYHKTIHTGIKPFTCDHCGKSYRTKDYISIHMKTHMTDSLLFPCTVCNKKIRSASNLKKHMFQHTGEKPFSCNICQRDFTDLSNRNKHMRRIHDIELGRKRHLIIQQQTADTPTSSDLATGDAKSADNHSA